MIRATQLIGLSSDQCIDLAYATALRIRVSVPDSKTLTTTLDDTLAAVAAHRAHPTPRTANALEQASSNCWAALSEQTNRNYAATALGGLYAHNAAVPARLCIAYAAAATIRGSVDTNPNVRQLQVATAECAHNAVRAAGALSAPHPRQLAATARQAECSAQWDDLTAHQLEPGQLALIDFLANELDLPTPELIALTQSCTAAPLSPACQRTV